ncbi:NIPSNAP family protein [Sunxiuqinia indica]|uniref:NIPSNAP family protein n=1 Tax=Sunxiuqinia indica TaxID=2692584 RepID=UPI00135704BE|nr:NIPSNAP family protein [Sunxiuqinia indica]
MRNTQSKKTLNQTLKTLTVVCLLMFSVSGMAAKRSIYQIKIYTLENAQQEQGLDKYLKEAFIPAMHRAGISRVGVFKPVEEDENAGKLMYVFIPFKSIGEFEKLESKLSSDKQYQADGSDYINAAFDHAPYARIESVLLRAFKSMPEFGVPTHSTPPSERIYELRSYQGATEKYYQKKVEMFTDGGESQLFIDLGFQPIFFGEVISGPVMPNLMYLTTFENKEAQTKRWDAFQVAPLWQTLKADKQYAHTVSHIDKSYLHPTDYSDL